MPWHRCIESVFGWSGGENPKSKLRQVVTKVTDMVKAIFAVTSLMANLTAGNI